MSESAVGLTDIGVNLTDKRFDEDRIEVIERARAAGVGTLVVIGTDLDHSGRAQRLCNESGGGMVSTAGVHPHHASHWNASSADRLRSLSRLPEVKAIGECGLDFFRDFSPRKDQLRCFEAQLALAAECHLPVYLHQRGAHQPLLALLRAYRADLAGAVAHCFTEGPAELEDYLVEDLYIGVTGWVNDERRGEALRASVPGIPPQRLLLETDAPYLLPRDLPHKPRNRRNEPAFLTHVCEAVAQLRGESTTDCARQTSENAARLFGL